MSYTTCTCDTLTGQWTDYCCSTNVSVPHSADRTEPSKLNIPKHEEKAPAPIDSSIDKWFYISGASA